MTFVCYSFVHHITTVAAVNTDRQPQ